MDLHVPVCADGSLHPVPPVVSDPVWVLSSPEVVQFAVCLSISALPRSGSGIPSYICGGDQQFSTCFLLHHHPGTGRWPARLLLVRSPFFFLPYVKHFQMPFKLSVGKISCNSCRDHFIICLIVGASNDESPLLCQGECTKSPDLGWRKDQYETFQLCSVLICRFIRYLYFWRVPYVDNKQSLLSSIGPRPVVPQVSQYLYFLFAPTLIYRDKYPRSADPLIVCIFFLYSSSCVRLKPCFSLMQKPSDQMGLRGHKVTSGTSLFSHFTAEFTEECKKKAIYYNFNHSQPTGARQSVLCLLHFRAAVHPSVSQHQSAAVWPEGHGPLCL